MRTVKKVFINLVAVIMAIFACMTLTACEDIKTVELDIQVYDYADNGSMQNYTMTVDLYRHLAPDTVDAIVKYIEEGLYDGKAFYKLANYSTQIMVGDIISDEIKMSETVKPELGKGEFERGGTTGSNLVNKKGSIGLWRSWTNADGSYTTSSTAMSSGRATWFIPTDTISAYDGYFCVFGQYDAEDDANKAVLDALTKAFTSGNYDEYVVYYTGEYDADKADENYGLTAHIVEKDDFDSSAVEGLFKSENVENKAGLVCYDYYTVQIPVNANGDVAAKIVSAKIS